MIGARLFTSTVNVCASSRTTALQIAAAVAPVALPFRGRSFAQTHDIYARRDRQCGNKIDRTNGKPCSMVNWIRKLPRRAGRCSALPERVIRCRRKMMVAYHARHANDGRLLPHQLQQKPIRHRWRRSVSLHHYRDQNNHNNNCRNVPNLTNTSK